MEIEKLIDHFPGQEKKLERALKTLQIRKGHLEKKSKVPGADNAHNVEVQLVQ